jgi:hypothetical protein
MPARGFGGHQRHAVFLGLFRLQDVTGELVGDRQHLGGVAVVEPQDRRAPAGLDPHAGEAELAAGVSSHAILTRFRAV